MVARRRSNDPYMWDVASKIDEFGVMIQGVGGDEETSSFSYTVGLAELDVPEVLIAGIPIPVAHSLLNTVHQRVLDGERLLLGTELVDLVAGGYGVMVCAVTADHEANVCRVLYGDDVLVRQLVFQDRHHHYPWELAYDTDPRVQKNWFIGPAAD